MTMRVFVVLALLVGLLMVSAGSSAASTEKEEGTCFAQVIWLEGRLKMKVKDGERIYDVRCRAKFEPGILPPKKDKGEDARNLCKSIHFDNGIENVYLRNLGLEVTKARAVIKPNGEVDIRCKYGEATEPA